MAPFAPHICEEIWSMLGEKEFISLAEWPKPCEKLTDVMVEESENLIKSLIDDTQNVIRATKTVPKKIHYYTCAPWKWKLYTKILEKAAQGRTETGQLIRDFVKDPELREHAKELASLMPKMSGEAFEMSEARRKAQSTIGTIDEYETLESARKFLSDEFKAQVYISKEENTNRYDPKQRAKLAKPYRPAIFIE